MSLLSQLSLKSLNNEFHFSIFFNNSHMIFLKINVLFNIFLIRILRILYILRIEIDIIILLFNTIIYKFDYDILLDILISYLLNILFD